MQYFLKFLQSAFTYFDDFCCFSLDIEQVLLRKLLFQGTTHNRLELSDVLGCIRYKNPPT